MKISKIFTLLCLLLASVALCGCTQNGGNIGIWFGTWHFQEITADGTVVTDPDGKEFFVQFQGKIVKLTMEDNVHSPYNATYGNWAEDDDRMQWTFPDPKQPLMPVPGITAANKFTILHRSATHVTLKQVSEAGVTYTYTLKKVI
ncbi:MAG: lipocalin-like domain-containing protein [Bacteroidales bacterium]|nr:lipocalin-like domain-containing protein [Bacteroidales bacterium]